MPKRIKDQNKSIFVKFNDNASDSEINSFLYKLGISGVRASSLINRWVIEIPFWKENYFLDKMNSSQLVLAVHDNFHRKNTREEIEEENSHE